MLNKNEEQQLSMTPINLYSNLFQQFETAFADLRQDKVESQTALTLALREWDKEQAYESYLLSKINSGEKIDIFGFNQLIKRKHIKDFNRVLAKLGLKEELAESIKLGYEEDQDEVTNGSVYFSIVAPALEELGLEIFIELLLYLRSQGIVKVNGLQNILMNRTIIQNTETEKRDLIERLMDLGFQFYKKRNAQERLEGTITSLTKEDLQDVNWMQLFGFQEHEIFLLDFLSSCKTGEFQKAIQTLLQEAIPPAVQREWVFYLIERQTIQEIGSKEILSLLNELTGRRISDSYYFTYKAAFRLIKLGYETEAVEFLEKQKILLKQYAQLENLPEWIAPTTLNRLPNLKILRGQKFESYSDIRTSLFVFRNLDQEYSYPRYILDFFKTTYPAIYSSNYVLDLKYSRKNRNLVTPIDYFFELQLAAITGDVEYWTEIFAPLANLPILDERHIYTGFMLVEESGDEEFRKWLLSNYPEKFKHSSYFLSAQIDFALQEENFESVTQLLLDWHQGSNVIRQEEIIGIARKTKPYNFGQVMVLFSSLNAAGIKIPGKAITSLCERFSTRNDEVSIVKCISEFAENVGPEIAYSELQLILIYLRQNRNGEARNIANSILRRNIDSRLREHIQKVFAETNDIRVNDIFDALKFEFSNAPNIQKRVTYSRNATGVSRLRDIVRELKSMYDDLCQICRTPLETPFGRISEAAHIQGLGNPHNGPDEIGNLICLCPNHHKLFDSSSFYFADDFKVVSTINGEILGELYIDSDHSISTPCIRYQRGYAIASSAKKLRKWN
jgi:hypothetical protein